jgi:hypothetical protein
MSETTDIERSSGDERRLARAIGIASQVVLAASTILLAFTGRWLATEFGRVSLFLALGGLAIAGLVYLRRGIRWPLMLVDLWFAFYGSVLAQPWPPIAPAWFDGTNWDSGPPDVITREPLLAVGGAIATVGPIWVIVGLVGAIAIARARVRR